MTPELVVFDRDGVLVDTEGPMFEVFATEGQDARLAEVGATVVNSMAAAQRLILG